MNKPETLARCVDYRRLAIRRGTLTGRLRLAALSRVLAATADAAADGRRWVDVELAWYEDSQRRVRVSGRITATLSLRCQRCLCVYAQALTPAVAGVVVASDQAAAEVPHADEPILARGDRLDTHALVSDELLLALPLVARCGRGDCRARFSPPAAPENERAAAKKPSPFAVLKTLKRDDEAT